MRQGGFPVLLRTWILERHPQVKRQPFPFFQIHQREPLELAFQHRGKRGRDVPEVEVKKLLLGVVQRGVPRGGGAHDTVLRGFAVDVSHFDFEKGDPGVGVVPDPHLKPGVLSSDVLPHTNVVGRVEIEVAVRRGHRVCDGQHRVVLQLGQRVAQPMFRHQKFRVVTVHQGHRFDVFQPQVGSSIQQVQEVHAGFAKVRCAPVRRVGPPKVECVLWTRYEPLFGP